MWRGADIVVATLLSAVTGFNLAPNHATIFGDPRGQRDSYFGYSVNLLARSPASSWVIVGAPRSNTSSHAELVEPGVSYQCSLASGGVCTPITLDTSGNIGPPGVTDWAFKHRKDHAWIGGAIDVQDDSDGGRIVVCGPRWKNQRHPHFYLMNGICYLKYYPFDSTDNAEPLMPLIHNRKQGYLLQNVTTNTTEEIFLYAYGEAGMSVHFTKKGEMLIGAPGVKQWAGTVIRYKTYEVHDEEEATSRNSFRQEVIIPNPLKTPQLTDFGHFGYSVDSGRFLKSSQKTHYVGGAPRAGFLKGKVFVFDFPRTDEGEFHILAELEGFQMGEYFGASVCVVDLNGDGLDDLVVGAPQHSLVVEGSARLSGDEGRVYVFINEDMGILSEISYKNLIAGSQVQGARFGTSIAKIGDINKDGYYDIAVGAPYEDSGRGAIYIYHGRSSGIQHKYSQRITAAEIHTSLSGFGISISKGMDIDGNYYNDLAVGAYSSGHVVVIPSQPVIVFRGRVYSHVTELALDATEFMAFACLTYSGYHAPSRVGAQITLNVLSSDGRAQFEVKDGGGRKSTTLSYKTSLGDRMEKCTDFRVRLQNENRDYTKPVELQMHYKLDSRQTVPVRRRRETILESHEFCQDCPVVDPSHATSVSWKLPYAIECGEDNICKADLTVGAEFFGIKPPFVLGAQPKLSLRVLVSNRGEQAFLVKLNVTLPRETPLSRLPTLCQEVTESEGAGPTQLECEIASNLAVDEKTEFFLEVDIGILAAKKSMLVFGFKVSSAGEEKSPDDNVYSITLPVKTLADVGIDGKSNQDKGVHAKENQTFFHTFEVTNNGPSPVNILRLEFKIPVIIKSQNGIIRFIRVYKPTAYFGKQPLSCATLRGSFASDIDAVTVNLNGSEEVKSISKRSIQDRSITDSLSDLPRNRTLFVNCSSPEVECLTVHCDAGPFLTRNNRAVVSFKLIADFEKIGPVLGKKDIVVISSVGKVSIMNLPNAEQPLDGQPDVVTVNSVFFGNMPGQTIDSWLLAVSIAGGLLIFLFIVGGLVKMGFFRRGTTDDQLRLRHNVTIKEDTKRKHSRKT